MLSNLAKFYNRPQILEPNLIEISAGFWDLRAMTEEDFIEAGIPKPYPKDSELAFGPIGKKREERWVRHASELMKDVARTFPGAKGVRDGPVLSWRTMHQPKRNSQSKHSHYLRNSRNQLTRCHSVFRLHSLSSSSCPRLPGSQDDARTPSVFPRDPPNFPLFNHETSA